MLQLTKLQYLNMKVKLMKIDSEDFNVKFLSILAYIGPLFLVGKFSAENKNPDVMFHTNQGKRLFIALILAYLSVGFIYFLIREFIPVMANIVIVAVWVAINLIWLAGVIYGTFNAIKMLRKRIPFIG